MRGRWGHSGAFFFGSAFSKTFLTHTNKTLCITYTWGLTHAAWNLLRRIEKGNTSSKPLARHVSLGYKIAIWWDGDTSGDKRWYTGKVVGLGDSQTEKQIKYDSDGSLCTHDLATTRWAPALPTPELKCPWCGHVGMSGGTGGGGYAGARSRVL